MKIKFTKDFANNWKAGDIVEAKDMEILVDDVAMVDLHLLLKHCVVLSDSGDSGEIKVGDKVKYRPSFTKEDAFGVVTGIDNDYHYAYIMDADGDFCTVIFADLIKTGESYPEIPEVLKRMRENIKADSAPQKYNYLRNIGYSSHDDESWYECPVCKKQYRSWNLFRKGINSGDVFQCECGEKLLYR